MTNNRKIYTIHNNNLGDHWTSYCLMAVVGEMHQTRYELGTINAGFDFVDRLTEIEALFNQHVRYAPILVREQGTHKIDAWLNWCFPALPVDAGFRWDIINVTKTVCYQFDGISSDTHKNPDEQTASQILNYFEELGYRCIRLGKHMSLQEVCLNLSQCALFVGCDSGISHVAHSVGCPVFMYEKHLPTETCHRLKQSDVFRNLSELRMKSQHWLQLLSIGMRLSTP